MTLLENMPHTVRHERPRYESDGLIGNRQVEDAGTVVASDLSAWVQNASMAEINQFQKREQRISHKVFFPTDPGLLDGDHIIVTAGPSFVGLDIRHLAESDRSAGLGVLFASIGIEEPNPRAA